MSPSTFAEKTRFYAEDGYLGRIFGDLPKDFGVNKNPQKMPSQRGKLPKYVIAGPWDKPSVSHVVPLNRTHMRLVLAIRTNFW